MYVGCWQWYAIERSLDQPIRSSDKGQRLAQHALRVDS